MADNYTGGGFGDDPTNDPGQRGNDAGGDADPVFIDKYTSAISGGESVGASYYGKTGDTPDPRC